MALAAALKVKAVSKVAVVPAVTSMPTVAALRLIVRPVSVYAVPPARRRPCVPEFALSRTTLVAAPRPVLALTERMPAVTSMMALVPPKVLVPVRARVPPPDFVSTILVAPVAPPLRIPLRTRPSLRLETLAVPTLYTGPVAPRVALRTLASLSTN